MTREILVHTYTHVILFYKQKSSCNIIIYSLNAQWVKNLPAMQETQETQIWSLGGEDPLEEGMVIHSSILAWRILWTGEPGGLQSDWSQSCTWLSDEAHSTQYYSKHCHGYLSPVVTCTHKLFQRMSNIWKSESLEDIFKHRDWEGSSQTEWIRISVSNGSF